MAVLKIINGIIIAYMAILVIRILLSWVHSPQVMVSREYGFLIKITEPFLSIFRRIKFLRTPRLDFSPIMAILSLQFVSFILTNIMARHKITIAIIAFFVLSAAWSVVSFLLIFFFVLFLVRIIVLWTRISSVNKLVMAIEAVIHPVIAWINVKFFKGRIVRYQTSLIVCEALIVTIYLLGKLGVNLLTGLLV